MQCITCTKIARFPQIPSGTFVHFSILFQEKPSVPPQFRCIITCSLCKNALLLCIFAFCVKLLYFPIAIWYDNLVYI